MKKKVLLTVLAVVFMVAALHLKNRFDVGREAPATPAGPVIAAAEPVVNQGTNHLSVGAAAQPAPAISAPMNAGATNAGVSREFDARVNPYAGALREPGQSKRAWDADFLKGFATAQSGDPIRFELTAGRMAAGTIQTVQQRDGEIVYLAGQLTEPEAGKFFFLQPPAGGKAGKAVGVIEFPASQTAYRIEPTGPDGAPELWQRRLDEVLCLSLPAPAAAAVSTNQTAEAPPLRPDAVPAVVPSYNTNLNGVGIVSLQSNPGSKAVYLLDFFGGYTPTWGGVNYSVPSAANNTTIKDVWKRVAEDYMPFNINVTTDIKVYQAAPASSRQRCCFTDTPITAAGVAYVGSWNWGSDTPCWSVYNTGKNGAEVAAHEGGHTLGLSHDTQDIPDGTNTTHVEYYAGHGSGATGWAPTMGVGYYQPVSTWSKGEYQYAGNHEDDLNVIDTANNNVAYRTDDAGGTLATSRYLDVFSDNAVFGQGVIERTADTDAFQFTTTGGRVALFAYPVGDWACLAIQATLADAADTVIASNNPQTTLEAGIVTNLAAGTYTFRVTGAGRNSPLTNGFSDYASLGYYSIAGSVAGARQPTRLAVMEHAANGTVVGPVPAADPNGALTYTIVSGNSNNTFSLDDSGVLSVANNALLDYDALASNTVQEVQFELFVNIVNGSNPALTELNRRVVVSVLNADANNPIDVTGFNAGVIAPYNASPGTPGATAFDLPNGWCFYQAGLAGNPQVGGSGGAQGLPASGRFASQFDNTVFRFGPYGGQNVLLLGRSSYPTTGTLTFATPRACNSIAILATSANGGGVGTFMLNFTNGTHSATFSFNAQDWYFTTTNVALQGFGRMRLGQSTLYTENPGFNNPNFYQTTLNLAALGLNQAIASITFTDPSGGGNQDAGIFAVSGVDMPPEVVITRQPQPVTNNLPASPVTLSVTAMGAPNLAYQWYQGAPGAAVKLNGKTAASLTFNPVTTNDAGTYFAVVSNSLSAATSTVASVTVFRAPQIVQQPSPASVSLFTGRNISFAVGANAALPVYYFWRFNNSPLGGASGSTYALNNVQLNQAGAYSVLVSNAYGVATSSVVTLSVLAPGYPAAVNVLADYPVGYWRLDETSGSVAHDYIAGNNGSYLNTLLGQPGNGLVDTHKAARFGALSSVNCYVSGIPIDFATTSNAAFSVEAWVNGNAQSSDAGLISKGYGSGGEQFNLDCGAGSHAFRFFVRDRTGGAHVAGGSVTPNGQWHHLVGVCDQANGNVILYVDGAANASATIAANSGLLSSTNPVTIGSRQSGAGTSYNFQFVGLMEEVAIYDYALSPAQVQAHFAAASNRAPQFASNPFFQGRANAGQAYAGTLTTNASDPNGDAMTFSKLSGPPWLAIGANGFLSGTPANNDANTNVFLVSTRDGAGASNTATMLIYVNGAPGFAADPFAVPGAFAGRAYSNSIAGQASDPNPTDTLTFAKLSGPAWLAIAPDGSLSGLPPEAQLGTNSFVVSVADGGGLTATATLTVAVMPVPELGAGLTVQGTNLWLNWSGGLGPYEVQMSTNLSGTNWQTIASDLGGSNLLVLPTNNAAFFRILSH